MSTIQADTPQAALAAPNAAVRKSPAADRRFARFLALDDFETAARQHLPRMLYGFISGGVETNAARQGNLDSFQDYAFIPRVLADVSRRSHGQMLFGRAYARRSASRRWELRRSAPTGAISSSLRRPPPRTFR